MKTLSHSIKVLGVLLLMTGGAEAHGIVNTIVNSPLSAAGTVRDARVGINVYLQSETAPGIEFMDPNVVGYGIPAGGRLEVELAEGFERDIGVPLNQSAIMLVTGAPQQGLPGKKVGYTVGEGADENTFVFTPSSPEGLPAETLMTPAPGAKGDPVRQRGIKVFHIGFFQSAFVNRGAHGRIEVRILDGAGAVVHRGSGTVDFLADAVPQILPTNLSDARRNHNWQAVNSGDILGKTPGTVPVTLMLFEKAKGVAPADMAGFKQGIVGAGVLSTQQLKAMGFEKPAAIARYNGGLIVQDTNGDGRLDPATDRIIGGVIGKAPKGARGQELKGPLVDGKLALSRPAADIAPKPGKRFGGAVMSLVFTAGNKPGKYRPTLALLSDPDDLASEDGSRYTYAIVVK